MFKKLRNKIRYYTSFFTRSSSTYGLTTDSKVVIKELPDTVSTKDMTFCKLNTDMNLFEIISVDRKKKEVMMRELTTDNEVTVSFTVYEYLFEQISSTEYLFK